MNVLEYDTPSSMPAVDRIQVVSLDDLDIGPGGDLSAADDRTGIAVEAGETQVVAELWRTLSPGEQARCHIPPFAFRFYAGDVLVQEASVFWTCNNIHGCSGNRMLFFEFDGESKNARQLLDIAQRVTGIQVSE